MTMKPDEAAKVLREHVAIRRKAGTGNPCVNVAIDAAVAALEAVAGVDVKPFAYGVEFPGLGNRTERMVNISESLLKDFISRDTFPLYRHAAPQQAYCCAKCGLAEMKTQAADHIVDANKMIHHRETALAQDAARGNFRAKP